MSMPGGTPWVLILLLGFLLIFIFTKIIKRTSNTKTNTIDKKVMPDLAKNYNNAKKIFINYRKEDSSGYSLALYHELIKWYDKKIIFKDFNNIDPGEDFEESIDNALNSCNILLVIISDKWLDILNQRQKQTKQKDLVTLEISTALLKNIYTIPITINGASMPSESELPDELKKLIRRQFLNIDQTRFETDTMKLVQIIDKKLDIQRKPI